MKRFLAALLLLPSLSWAAALDYGLDRRTAANNNWEKVLLNSPSTVGIMAYDPASRLASWLTLGAGVQVSSGVISATADWSTLSGKPTFATVATSGAYTDLSGKPSIPAAQVNADWTSVSGVSQILNKPTLFSGAYVDLTGKPTLFSGAYGDLTGTPSFATVATSGLYSDLVGAPTIPAAQVNSDWNAVAGAAQILNKPALFSGSYGDLTGVPSAFPPSVHTHAAADIVSGTLAVARIPTLAVSQTSGLQAALDSKFATPTGTTAQYLRGDGTLATFPSIPATQVNADWNSSSGVSQILNKPSLATVATTGAYADLTGKPTIPAAQVNSDWNAVSGAAQILNKPTLNSGTVTSVTAGTGLSGGTITNSGTISLPNIGTSGTYATVTTDAQGRVVSGTGRSFTRPSRTLNTAFQISTTRDAWVVYTVDVSVTSLLLAGTSGRVYLEYADNSAMTTNVVTVNSTPNATGGVLNVTNLGGGNVTGWIPAGKWARIRTVNVTGTPTFTIQPDQQEVLQ